MKILITFICLCLLSCSAVAQSSTDELESIIKNYNSYSVTIDDSLVAQQFTSKELQKLFTSAIPRLKNKKFVAIAGDSSLHFTVYFTQIDIHKPGWGRVVSIPQDNMISYDITTVYSLSVAVLATGSISDSLVLQMADNIKLTKHEKFSYDELIKAPKDETKPNRNEISDEVAINEKRYMPNAHDLKGDLITIFQNFRKRKQ